ncbi:MAG: permease-like cell division protein FtsX [Arenimonas sp.]|nr:permease-like cell division protein FtsX [Arenimonas sp.]
MSTAGKGEARSKPAAARVSEGGLGKRLRAWRGQHAYSLVSSLGRFFQRPFSTLLTVGVMAVAMALPLGLGLALGNIERLSGSVRESREIGVFLNAEVSAAQAERIAEQIRQRPDVAELTIKTPEQGLAEFRQLSDLAGALELLKENPLPTVLLVQPTDDGSALATALQARPEVDLVQHDALWRQRLSAWLAFGRQLMWVIAGLLGLGVLLVVGNTVRLEIGNRRDEIAVLQQLGATDGFIRRPFIYLGAWYGLGAGVLALGLVAVAAAMLQPTVASLIVSYSSHFTLRGPDWRMVVVMLFTATVLGWFGAWLASGHHLRQTRPTDL